MADQSTQNRSSGSEPGDWELVDAAQRGDRDAFGLLYQRHGRHAYNVALRMVGDPWTAADLTQDAFLKAFRGLGSFSGSAKFSTWLHRIVMNAAYDHLRRQRAQATDDEILERARSPKSVGPGGEGPGPSPGRALGAAEGLDPVQDQLSAPVREALLALDADFRSAVVLCDLLGYTYAEAADILEVREGTVKSRLYRGRAALADRLAELGYGPGGSQKPNQGGPGTATRNARESGAAPRDGPEGEPAAPPGRLIDEHGT